MPYSIEEHKHRFSAWAAGRAASVNGCRFSVEQAKTILETAHLNDLLADPNKLPMPQEIDNAHRDWRGAIIDAAQTQRLSFTHGVAAKLINIYLKAGFVCGGQHAHERVRALHPPIDSVLLDELSAQDIIDDLVETGLFVRVDRLTCPDSGYGCSAIRLNTDMPR